MLTDAWLKANNGKSRPKREEKTDRDSLSARVTTKGKVVLQTRYRYNGKPKRLDLGSYPLMSLKEAREENTRLRKELEQGHDPQIVKQLEKRAIVEAGTVEELFSRWYNAVCINKKSGSEIKRNFELHVFPRIGELPADRVTLHEWLAILEELAPKTPMIASRILSNTRQCLKWGVKRQLIPANPLTDIFAKEDLQIVKNKGERTLSDDEIAMVWRALDGSRLIDKNSLFVKLCLIYGCRNGELRLAEKSHFDFEVKTWTIPPALHKTGKKTGKPIIRPITPEIEPYLERAIELSGDSPYMFLKEEGAYR